MGFVTKHQAASIQVHYWCICVYFVDDCYSCIWLLLVVSSSIQGICLQAVRHVGTANLQLTHVLPCGWSPEKLVQSTQCTVWWWYLMVPFFRISDRIYNVQKWCATRPSWCFKNISLFQSFYVSEKVTAISKTSLRACGGGFRTHSHFHLCLCT